MLSSEKSLEWTLLASAVKKADGAHRQVVLQGRDDSTAFYITNYITLGRKRPKINRASKEAAGDTDSTVLLAAS